VTTRSGSAEAGDRLLERLAELFEKLAEFPSLGRSRPELRPGVRSFASPPFMIFYRRRRNGVHIARVLHERQNVVKAFPKRRKP
jgi:toxin ParE1/3/4